MTQSVDRLPTEVLPQDEPLGQGLLWLHLPSPSRLPAPKKVFAGGGPIRTHSPQKFWGGQTVVDGPADGIVHSVNLEDMFLQISRQLGRSGHVGEEDPITGEKRRALIAEVEAAEGRPNVEPAAIATMKVVVQALPGIALEPEVVVSEDDGTIEFDWESEAGRGAFTVGVLPSGHVIYDWVWGHDQAAGRTKLEDGELRGFIKCCLKELGRKLSDGL